MRSQMLEVGHLNSKLELPDISMLSEWFTDDQSNRIDRLRAATLNAGPYSVYDVYNSKGSL